MQRPEFYFQKLSRENSRNWESLKTSLHERHTRIVWPSQIKKFLRSGENFLKLYTGLHQACSASLSATICSNSKTCMLIYIQWSAISYLRGTRTNKMWTKNMTLSDIYVHIRRIIIWLCTLISWVEYLQRNKMLTEIGRNIRCKNMPHSTKSQYPKGNK